MSTETGGGATPPRTLAAKLEHLFDVVRPEDGEGRQYTGREVTAELRAAGTDMSASHLSELRRGLKTNPTLRVLQGLADFFRVRVGYFFDDPAVEAEVEAELELRAAMRDARVHEIALRAAALTSTQRQALQRLLAGIIADPPTTDQGRG